MENKLPQRKDIRLKNYDYSSTGAYFVTICTKDRRPLLSQIVKRPPSDTVGDGALDVPQIQLTEIGAIVEETLLTSENIPGVKIDQYVIMPDHIHAIIFVLPKNNQAQSNGTSRAPSPTNQMLPHIISTFKRFCNKKLGYNIFQRTYIEHIIRDKNDYETKRTYIYENPIRWYYNSAQS